jgi:hypothetical protein
LAKKGAGVNEVASAGDDLPPDCKVIEVSVAELKQLFNSIDPSPFDERDLDPRAEEFIVSWSKELPSNAPLGLRVHVDRRAGMADEAVVLRDAIHQFFSERSNESRRELRQLFHRGRISLVIGLAFLGASIAFSELLGRWVDPGGVVNVLRESLSIGGWVAMWRPLEVFLYDWWPIRAEARLFHRLAVMPVCISYAADSSADAWRRDWPAASSTRAAH